MDSSAAREEEGTTSLPERSLNLAILFTAFVSKAMNGLGTLATIWATVVLLGGFSTLIKQQDFWYVTVVAFVESIGILSGYEDPTQQFFLRAPEVLIKSTKAEERERQISWWRRRITPHHQQQHHQSGGARRSRLQVGKHEEEHKCDGETCLGAAIYAALRLGQIAAVAMCIVLSLRRLKKQDYVDPENQYAESHRNIRRSLNIFYGLVLAQGIIFIVLRLNPVNLGLSICIRHKYRLYGPSGSKIMNRYWGDNYMEFVTGNWRATLKMGLITFAMKLAVSDSDVNGRLVGIRAMDRILRSGEYNGLALTKLRASLDADALGKLVDMLGFACRTREDVDMRGHAARVLVKVAPDILADTHPQAMYLISYSLLETAGNMDVDLVWLGLRILDKLTDIQYNCRQANDLSDDLLPKIVDLTNLNLCGRRHGHGHGSSISDSWIEQEIIPLLQREEDIPPTSVQKIDRKIIVGMSLKILSKLLATPGHTGKELREKASAIITLTNTGMILEHVGAAQVIACLALDEKEKKEIAGSPEIIKKLKDCLLSKAPHVDITKVAAKLLLMEYTTSEQLTRIQLSIEEKNILQEDAAFSVPTTAFIEALDLDQLLPPWMQKQQLAVQNLDLEDVISAGQVNRCEAAAKALVVLTTGCDENAAAVLQQITLQEMEMIVAMLFPQDREESRRSMQARLQGRNLHPQTLRVVKKIICAEGGDRTRSVHAKLLQNLRAHCGTENFIRHMRVIDQALPQVLKAILDEVTKLEYPVSTTGNLVDDDELWVKAGKVLESFIGLAVQICTCGMDASGFDKTLEDVSLTVDSFVPKLKKILELYMYPTTDFPSIRRSTLELITWMVQNNSKYRETVLQCGVYEQLKEVAKTTMKHESFELFHCDVGIGNDHIKSISSLVSDLQAELELCPNFHGRSHYYGEHAGTITVLVA